MMGRIRAGLGGLKASLLDEQKRIRLQFIWIYGVLMTVSFFMTVVNIVTGKHLLMLSTLVFGVLCCINMFLAHKGEKALQLSGYFFSVELIALLTFFVVSGTPEGFSAIWACLLPASGLLIFRRKRGTILCAAMLLILVFLLQTPLGNSFLHYPYTTSFKLRFPMLYVAFFAVSFLLETIRALTFAEMKKAQAKYEYLYRHDALTGLYNRYGFNERMDALLDEHEAGPIALLILDMDCFKRINDAYGHAFGDVVLQNTAALLVDIAGPNADVCRWGGEEFAIMLRGEEDAAQCGSEILNALRETAFQSSGTPVKVTASIGVVTATSHAELNPAVLVRAADNCLYSAKESGRDTLVHRTLDSNAA